MGWVETRHSRWRRRAWHRVWQKCHCHRWGQASPSPAQHHQPCHCRGTPCPPITPCNDCIHSIGVTTALELRPEPSPLRHSTTTESLTTSSRTQEARHRERGAQGHREGTTLRGGVEPVSETQDMDVDRGQRRGSGEIVSAEKTWITTTRRLILNGLSQTTF